MGCLSLLQGIFPTKGSIPGLRCTVLLSMCVCACKLNCVQLFVTLLDGSLLGSSARGLPMQEHWSGLPFVTPRDLPDPGTDPRLCVCFGRWIRNYCSTWEGHWHLHLWRNTKLFKSHNHSQTHENVEGFLINHLRTGG